VAGWENVRPAGMDAKGDGCDAILNTAARSERKKERKKVASTMPDFATAVRGSL